MKKIRVRACGKCREYVVIHANDPTNQGLIKTFEGKHRGHTLITLDIEEVKGQYTNFSAQSKKEEGAEAEEEIED